MSVTCLLRSRVLCIDNLNGAPLPPPPSYPHSLTLPFSDPLPLLPFTSLSPPSPPSGKMHRMREATYFLDPPAYYSQPGAGQSVVVSAGGAQGGSQGGTKGASFPSNR